MDLRVRQLRIDNRNVAPQNRRSKTAYVALEATRNICFLVIPKTRPVHLRHVRRLDGRRSRHLSLKGRLQINVRGIHVPLKKAKKTSFKGTSERLNLSNVPPWNNQWGSLLLLRLCFRNFLDSTRWNR